MNARNIAPDVSIACCGLVHLSALNGGTSNIPIVTNLMLEVEDT